MSAHSTPASAMKGPRAGRVLDRAAATARGVVRSVRAGAGRRGYGTIGSLDSPRAGDPVARESLRVVGWALFLHSTVSHVEILIDGCAVGRARIGLARPGLRAGHPDAAVCGFEWIPGPGELPDDRDRVRLEALVTSIGSETFHLSLPEEIELEPPEASFEDTDGYARRLRQSTERVVGPRSRSASGPGLPSSRPRRETRVLAFTHDLDHGGAQRYFFEQVRYLLRDPEISCTVVAPKDGVWRRRLETIGADVHLSDYPMSGVLEYESAIAQLAGWARQREFDVAFASTLDTFLGADLCARIGLPLAWSLHESFPVPNWWLSAHGHDGHPYVRTRLDDALARTPALIFAADATRRLYEPYADPARMVTAPYGLELGDIDSFRNSFDPQRARQRRARFGDEAVLVLCLGTINSRKAQAVLAQAFAKVAGDHPSAHLVLVGDAGGSYAEGIRRFVKAAGLTRRCTLVPITSDPYSWHEVADVFALTSDIESSPISILEAMAFETPVVASRVFGVPELIEDGRHGYLCEPSDVGDLARALDRVLSAGPAERRKVALAGAERVRRRHEPTRYARSLRRLLLDLVAEGDALPSWYPEAEASPGESARVGAVASNSSASSPGSANGWPSAALSPAESSAAGDDRPWPTVREDLTALIRAAARAERGTVDAATVDWLLGYASPPDPSLADRIACLERLRLEGASVLEVGSVLGELSRTARSLGADVVDGVQLEPALVRLAGLVNAYRHTSRVFFHAGFDDLAARPERYDVTIVSASVTTEETIRAVELASRAVVLELTGAVDPSVLSEALATGFPSRMTLGEVSGIGEPSVMFLLAQDEDTLLELTSGASDDTAVAWLEKDAEHA